MKIIWTIIPQDLYNIQQDYYGLGLGTSRILYLPIQDVNEVIHMITGVDLKLTEKFK